MDSQSSDLQVVLATLGFVSLGLLWLGVVTGFLLRGSWKFSRPAVHRVHLATTGPGLCLGVVHGIGQLAVPGGSITVLELVVPFADSDNRIGTAVAVVGSEILLAVALSGIIQWRLGPARWRSLHLFSYVAFMLIVAHVLISGTEVTPVWVWLPLLAAWLMTAVMWLMTTSLPRKSPPDRSRRAATSAGRPSVLLDRDGGPDVAVIDVTAVPGVRRRPAITKSDR